MVFLWGFGVWVTVQATRVLVGLGVLEFTYRVHIRAVKDFGGFGASGSRSRFKYGIESVWVWLKVKMVQIWAMKGFGGVRV